MEATLIIGDGQRGAWQLFANWNRHWEYNTLVLSEPLSSSLLVPVQTLNQFTSVLLAPTDVYPPLDHGLQKALCDFVAQGGLLLCLPFTAWSCFHHSNGLLSAILPVEAKAYWEGKALKLLPESLRLPTGVEREWTTSLSSIAADFTPQGIMVSGEFVEPKSEAEVLAVGMVGETAVPIVTWIRHGEGSVLHFNACSHAIQDRDIWSSDQENSRSPLLECLRVYKSYVLSATDRDIRRSRGTQFIRFVEEFAHVFYLASVPRDDEKGDFLSIDRVPATYAHYGDGSPKGMLFPDLNEFTSMTPLSRLFLARAVFTVMNILWSRERGVIPSRYLADMPPSPNSSEKFNRPFSETVVAELKELINPSAENKKNYLEWLATYVLSLVPGLRVIDRDVRTLSGEVDILVENQTIGGYWGQQDRTVAVECKNWTKPAGAKELRDFLGKMVECNTRTGLYLSYRGVTGDGRKDAGLVIREARQRGQEIVVVDNESLRTCLCFLDPTTTIKDLSQKQLRL